MPEVGYLHTSFWEENMISSVQVRVIFCLDCSTNLPKPAQHLLVIQHAHPSTTNGNDSEGSVLVIFEKMNQSRRDAPKEREQILAYRTQVSNINSCKLLLASRQPYWASSHRAQTAKERNVAPFSQRQIFHWLQCSQDFIQDPRKQGYVAVIVSRGSTV